MTNEKRKEIAKRYFLSVSNNEVKSCRMSPVRKGDVVLKVYNKIFNSSGSITIGVRPEFNELLLISEIGVHGRSELSKFND